MLGAAERENGFREKMRERSGTGKRGGRKGREEEGKEDAMEGEVTTAIHAGEDNADDDVHATERGEGGRKPCGRARPETGSHNSDVGVCSSTKDSGRHGGGHIGYGCVRGVLDEGNENDGEERGMVTEMTTVRWSLVSGADLKANIQKNKVRGFDGSGGCTRRDGSGYGWLTANDDAFW